MRRRERYAGLVWLERLRGDGERPVAESGTTALLRVGGLVDELVHRFGVLVELEYSERMYTVRCIPRGARDGSGRTWVAVSYRGADLRNILRQATLDLAALENGADGAVYNAREVHRWVA